VAGPSLVRRATAECIGTAFLLIAVVGSGIAAARLSHDHGLRLFENAAVTAAALMAIILAVGPVSGAHLNPAITWLDRAFRGVTTSEALAYTGAQLAGAVVGTILANAMFGLSLVSVSHHVRTGSGLWLGEAVATFGLALVVFGVVRSGRIGAAPFAVGAYIGGAYFFTSSTSFANPAVTLGRTLSDTFAGIDPSSVLAFWAAQVVGATLAFGAIRLLYPDAERIAPVVVLPHQQERTGGREE
jgi:glycerol uptake facilitator-like aquaporin